MSKQEMRWQDICLGDTIVIRNKANYNRVTTCGVVIAMQAHAVSRKNTVIVRSTDGSEITWDAAAAGLLPTTGGDHRTYRRLDFTRLSNGLQRVLVMSS